LFAKWRGAILASINLVLAHNMVSLGRDWMIAVKTNPVTFFCLAKDWIVPHFFIIVFMSKMILTRCFHL
ncbi:hypothetical protein, partial [Paenibacillus polymyxa]|uniref:hypothetical protein n=1 Tax=Paenibacillus polymyxa TaxID=1406 RepID=UPI001E4101E6